MQLQPRKTPQYYDSPVSGLDELEIEREGNFFADENSAGFEGGVPREPEVLAIDFGRG